MDKFCECTEVGQVARDMKSTCMKCGGVDAYKKSVLRPENQEVCLVNKGDSEENMQADLEEEKVLKDLLYAVDGMCDCYRKENYGEAKDWVRHVNDAYTNYQEFTED